MALGEHGHGAGGRGDRSESFASASACNDGRVASAGADAAGATGGLALGNMWLIENPIAASFPDVFMVDSTHKRYTSLKQTITYLDRT